MGVMKKLAMVQVFRNRRLHNCLGDIRDLCYNRHEDAGCNGKRPMISQLTTVDRGWSRLVAVDCDWSRLIVVGRGRLLIDRLQDGYQTIHYT